MHAASPERSERLQRALEVLSDGREHTTRDLVRRAHICAVNSVVAELRQNGYRIVCRQRGRRWYYRMEVDDGTDGRAA